MTLSLNVRLGFLLLSLTLPAPKGDRAPTETHTCQPHTLPTYTHIRITANGDKPDHIYFPPEDFLVRCSFSVKS